MQSQLVAAQQRQSSNLLGASAAGSEQRPTSEVETELRQLDGAIGDLVHVSTELTARLAPVQMPANVTNAAGQVGTAPEALLSPMAEEIRAKRRGIDEITRQLRSALCGLAI